MSNKRNNVSSSYSGHGANDVVHKDTIENVIHAFMNGQERQKLYYLQEEGFINSYTFRTGFEGRKMCLVILPGTIELITVHFFYDGDDNV